MNRRKSIRTAWSDPEGSWQRLGQEPIRNHAVTKTQSATVSLGEGLRIGTCGLTDAYPLDCSRAGIAPSTGRVIISQ
jgi:hypothetical protein